MTTVFQIGYQQLLRLRCWHPTYLGSMAGSVPYNGGNLDESERKDLLRYDVRNFVRILPTAAGAATLKRFGLKWVTSTLGGWVLSEDSLSLTNGEVLQLGIELLDPGFAAATDFSLTTGVNLFQLPGQPQLIGACELDLTGPPETNFDLNFQPTNP